MSHRLTGLVMSLLILPLHASEWNIRTLSGNGFPGFAGDFKNAASAIVDNPFGVVRGPDGALWFCEYGGGRVRRIRPDGMIFTVAGNGKPGFLGDGGPALQASFSKPQEVRFNEWGDAFIADMANHAVRKMDLKTGKISTIAGTGFHGYEGDGETATAARLCQPQSIQFGPDGNLYICDTGNNAIRMVETKTGIITTVAGTGSKGPTPNGFPVSGTPLNGPRAIDFDKEGNLWVVTKDGNQVFKLDLAQGRIYHIAGTGAKGFTGNGGPAKAATFSGPKGIAIDAEGNAWIADTENHAVRRIDAKTGIVELMAGTGTRGDGPDGDPLQCQLSRVHGVFVDKDGAVYIGDSESHRIRVLRRAKIE
jgi:streptogramin lyase